MPGTGASEARYSLRPQELHPPLGELRPISRQVGFAVVLVLVFLFSLVVSMLNG